MTDEEQQRYNAMVQRAIMAEERVGIVMRHTEGFVSRMVREVRWMTAVAFLSGTVFGSALMHWWVFR